MATGRAWYVSYGGVTEWRFLRASDQTLPSLSLGDVDGNGRTDVAAWLGGTWHVSWDGASEFQPVGTPPSLPSQEFYADGALVGDFTGDGVADGLAFDPDGDRIFWTVDGASGDVTPSWTQM